MEKDARGLSRAQQLELFVDRSAGPDACWSWTRIITYRGYGLMNTSGVEKGLTKQAHRFAWEWENQQEAPKGMVVRHTCDVAACCNPSHLILGSEKDNVHDAIKRGRRRYIVGSAAARAKLNETQVYEIRVALSVGTGTHDLAEKYDVSVDNIRCIRDWKTWKHVTLDGISVNENQISGTFEEGFRLFPGAYPIPIGPKEWRRKGGSRQYVSSRAKLRADYEKPIGPRRAWGPKRGWRTAPGGPDYVAS